MDTWLYYNDKNNKNRYALGKIEDITKPVLIWFGINPSTAEPKDLTAIFAKIKDIKQDFSPCFYFAHNMLKLV